MANSLIKCWRKEPAPAEGWVAPTNPPSLIGLPESDTASCTLQSSCGKDFGADSTVTIGAIELNLYHPPETVRAGKWYWRYRAVRTDGTISARRIGHLAGSAPSLFVHPFSRCEHSF